MSTYETITVIASAIGTFALVVTIVAGMFRIMYLVGIHKNKVDQNTTNIQKLESSIDTRFIRIEDKFNTLDSKFSTLDSKFSTLDSKFSTLDSKFSSLEKVVRFILSIVQGDKGDKNSMLISPNSPLHLTQAGIKAKELMQIDAVIDRLYITLESEAMKSHPDNAYDIQTQSLQSTRNIMDRLTKEELTRLKDYAYTMGEPIEILTDLFGLVLRDKILKLHNIPIPQPYTPDTDTTTTISIDTA